MPQGFPGAGLAHSFRCAFRGLAHVLRTQRNAGIHAGATVAVVAAGFVLGVSPPEWCLLVLAMAAVWSLEALNTAVERLGMMSDDIRTVNVNIQAAGGNEA